MGKDLIVGRIATAEDWSNTPEGGARLKGRAPGEREMEEREIGETGHFLVDPKLGSYVTKR